MTTEGLMRFFEGRFEPVILYLSDGRQLHIRHPESVMVGRHAMTIYHLHASGEVELIDAACIVSIRTLFPTEFETYSG